MKILFFNKDWLPKRVWGSIYLLMRFSSLIEIRLIYSCIIVKICLRLSISKTFVFFYHWVIHINKRYFFIHFLRNVKEILPLSLRKRTFKFIFKFFRVLKTKLLNSLNFKILSLWLFQLFIVFIKNTLLIIWL